MKGDHHLLALTTAADEITGEVKPLFAFPVQVCKATDDGGDVKFDGAAPSGAEYETQYRDTVTGEVFEYEARQRGVRVGDEFHAIPDEQITKIEEATKIKTMVALGRVDLDTVPFERARGTYFLQSPAKQGSPKAYRLTYEALRAREGKGKAAKPAQAIVTKRTARSRQKIGVIYADEKRECLVLVELSFAAQLREPDEQVLAPQKAEIEDKQVNMARKVLAGLPDGAHALDAEVDEAVTMKRELVEKAIAGEAVEAPKAVAETTATDDLTAALEASLG